MAHFIIKVSSFQNIGFKNNFFIKNISLKSYLRRCENFTKNFNASLFGILFQHFLLQGRFP